MINLLELFGGIGACTKAFENLGIDVNVVDYVEIDRFAVASYNAIHGTNFTPQDVSKWDKNLNIDLIMHGSPCQDFSISGYNAGGDEGSGTRSSLMYETVRIVKKLKPKYIIWENVKNLLSKKHIHNFNNYINLMDQLGYNSYYQVLNAKDYGIPQNRERVFTISVRKDLNQVFYFPPKQPLQKKLKDLLDDKVEDKYYLKKALNLIFTKNYIQYSNSGKMQNSQAERAYYSNNDCMCTVSSSNSNGDKTQIAIEPFIKVQNPTKKGYLKAYDGDSTNLQRPNSKTRRGRVGTQIAQTLDTQCEQAVVIKPEVIGGVGEMKSNDGKQFYQQDRIYNDKIAMTVTTQNMPYYGIENKINVVGNYSPSGHEAGRIVGAIPLAPTIKENHGTVNGVYHNLQIRKLTPLECWRLMGFSDEDFKKASKVNSNTQLYKQAGNSIVVNVLEAILKSLLINPVTENENLKAEIMKDADKEQYTLFDYI